MKKTKPTAGERVIASAKEALAFAKGRPEHGCEVHVPKAIDVNMGNTGEKSIEPS